MPVYLTIMGSALALHLLCFVLPLSSILLLIARALPGSATVHLLRGARRQPTLLVLLLYCLRIALIFLDIVYGFCLCRLWHQECFAQLSKASVSAAQPSSARLSAAQPSVV